MSDHKSKISTGANDRPRDETIAQSGEGLPDDSGKPIEVDDDEVERVKAKLTGSMPGKKATPHG